MQKIRIAITGGIGSGKSTALAYLRENGYTVFSCDEIYKVISLSEEYIAEIKKFFPTVIIEGKINRTKLSEIVFNDEQKRKKLNMIAHPLIIASLLEQMDKCKDRLIFAEVPLLFENNYEQYFDKIFYIDREKEERINSVMQRDKLSISEVQQRIASQFDPHSKIGQIKLNKTNVFIIKNDGNKEELKEILNEILLSM